MAFGFPPYAVMTRRYVLRSFELADLVEETLGALGWKYEARANGEFVARTCLSTWSWGEKVHIKINASGIVAAKSQCVWPLQWLDFGKNQHNLVEFFHELWSLMSAQQLIEAADRTHPYIAAGHSPVEEIISEDFVES